MKKILAAFVLCFGLFTQLLAQEVTDGTKKEAPAKKYTRTTFNATKIINMQSTEIVNPGILQFMISHHFSNIYVAEVVRDHEL